MVKKRHLLFLFFSLSIVYLNSETPGFYPDPAPEASVSVHYQEKDFSHLLGELNGINNQLLKMHFTLYKGYVKNANALVNAIQEMRQKRRDQTLAYGALLRRFAWEFDGMILHEYYFENLGKMSELKQKDPLYLKIVEDFGSFRNWMSNFAATGLIRGTGWVILYQNPKDGRLNNIWIDDHNINHLPGGKPLLVMDVWEHAYITEYSLDRAGYIKAFLQNINWEEVSRRYREKLINETQPVHFR